MIPAAWVATPGRVVNPVAWVVIPAAELVVVTPAVATPAAESVVVTLAPAAEIPVVAWDPAA
jgi:hypothetical protein